MTGGFGAVSGSASAGRTSSPPGRAPEGSWTMIPRSTVVISALAVAMTALTGSVPTDPAAVATAAMVSTVVTTDRPSIFERPTVGVVMLYASARRDEVSAGTGIVISSDGPDGVVITNAHVVREAKIIAAHDSVTGRDYPVAVVGADPVHDIAVLRLGGAGEIPEAVLGDSDTLRIGQAVAAVGNVSGTGRPVVSEGVITALGRRVISRDAAGGHSEQLRDMIETDAWVRPGDSGGPLIATSGQVIGVDTAADGRHGYAIEINAALSYAHSVADFSVDAARNEVRSVLDVPGKPRPDRRGLLAADLRLGSPLGRSRRRTAPRVRRDGAHLPLLSRPARRTAPRGPR